jgi:hypothetical protein
MADLYNKTVEEDLEDKIIIALAPLATAGVDVNYFPENEAEYRKTFVKPRVTVACHSIDPGEERAIGMEETEDMTHVQIMFESAKLRGALGIWDIKRQVNDILKGKRIPNWDRLKMGKFTYAERREDTKVWVYNWIVTAKGVSQQAVDDISPSYAIPGLPSRF